MNASNTLIIITGPTGSGKSALALALAKKIGCHIISADSRQIYRDIPIGTAAPTAEDMRQVPHHFVGTLDLSDYYSAAMFEEDVMNLLPKLWDQSGGFAIMCGGSMMYVDAIVKGIDNMPTVSDSVRAEAYRIYNEGGIEAARAELARLDPDYYAQVDLNNYKRIVHAIEISMEAGVPYSTLRTGQKKSRPFAIKKFAIDMPREILFDRINRRTQEMIAAGLADEARAVMHLRNLNSLNTVGYKEMFEYLDGRMPLDEATEKIARNTRVYAKKQLTWLKKDPDTIFLNCKSDMIQRIMDSI